MVPLERVRTQAHVVQRAQWLREIGNVNSNSFGRFSEYRMHFALNSTDELLLVASKERDAGGGNSTYPKGTS